MKHIAFALALVVPAAGSAQDFRFEYSPRNLATPAGMESLHTALQRQATRYCRDQMPVFYMSGLEACVSEIIEQTVKEIGDVSLATYQRERGPRSS